MQTKHDRAPAAPSANVSNNGTTGPGGTQILASGAKLNGSLRLRLRAQLFKGGFCRSHPCALLAKRDPIQGVMHTLGATASMDEQGYVAVAELKDDQDMFTFIVRVIEDYDCHVEDASGLMGIVPWFSGTTAVQSLAKLEEALLFAVLANGERWLSYKNSAGITGATAPLDLQGYMEIAIIRKRHEMETFARRLAHQMSIKVTDEGGFKGMLRYHTGAAAFQSFDKLQDEIRAAAKTPHAWARPNSH